MDVHVRDLRYFLAVADELHFTRAAERLFISQPALSKQIRALERQLGVPLFERGPRAVRLTPAGAGLVAHARAIVERWGTAERTLVSTAAHTLVLGMQTSPGRGLLGAVRARLARDGLDVGLELRQVGWEDPSAGLVAGGTDAAFVWLPLATPTAFAWITVAREPRLVALPAGHRLAAREAVVLADLYDEPFLALPRSAGPGRDYWLAAGERDGHPVTVAAEITDTEETYEAVASGIGICLLAAGNAPILDRPGIVMRPVEGLSPAELVLAWRAGQTTPLIDAFVTACEAVVAEAARK